MIHYMRKGKFEAVCGWKSTEGTTLSHKPSQVTCKRCLYALGKLASKDVTEIAHGLMSVIKI
jgi:hypothetical protein